MMLPVKRLVCWGVLALLLAVSVGSGRAAATESRGAPGKASAPEVSKALDLADIIARARPAVVVVLAQDAKGEKVSQGSGFIVTPDGLVVTNWHVVGGASTALVKQESGAFYPVEGVVAWDAEHDFAILKIAGKGLATVRMGDSDKVRQGDRVLVLGSPQGLENTASEGIVSAVRELPGGQKLLQTTAAISEGSSGGPILNMQGEVIGIASFMLIKGQNLNFAIPINDVEPKVKMGKVTPLAEADLPSATGSAEALFLEGLRAVPADESAPGARAKFEAALALFLKAVDKRKDYWDAWFGIAYCLDGLGRYQDAIEAYRQAIRIKPDVADAYSDLGAACGRLGRYQEAVEAFQQAIRIKPDLAEAHYNLGIAYGELGRWPEAVAEYKEAIRLKPDLAAHYNLGVAYGKLGRYQEAVDAYKQAIRVKPDLAEAHNNLGVAYANLGRYQEAIEAFKQAIRIKPDLAAAHCALGLTHLILGDRGAALDEYKILKDLDADLAAKLFKLLYP
jgi:tetratricopeptide (TPR) repeat protein